MKYEVVHVKNSIYTEEQRGNICQCRNKECSMVFPFADKVVSHGRFTCPHCGGSFSLIQLANQNDEKYLNKLANQYSE